MVYDVTKRFPEIKPKNQGGFKEGENARRLKKFFEEREFSCFLLYGIYALFGGNSCLVYGSTYTYRGRSYRQSKVLKERGGSFCIFRQPNTMGNISRYAFFRALDKIK